MTDGQGTQLHLPGMEAALSGATEGRGNSVQVPQPIPYQGSKRRLAPIILQHVPARPERLVEPFAGSAALSIAAAARGCADAFWINDAHEPLLRLWQEILHRPENLADRYARRWHAQIGRERAYYDQIRQRFNAGHDPADFLYLLARCVKAAIRYNARGEFNNTPDNRRRGARPAEMRRRLVQTARLLGKRTILTTGDYTSVLTACTPRDLVYMDPPYQGVCGPRDSRYLPPFRHDEFCRALAGLNARGIKYIVSYDGRTGDKAFGEPLPSSLQLRQLEVCAGRSTQATLLGRTDVTYESLYLSPAIWADRPPSRHD